MAYSVIQSATANSISGSTLGKAFVTANITVGNVIVVVAAASASATPVLTVSDNAGGGAGNTYTPLVSNPDATNTDAAVMWSAPITVGGGTKPTVTISNGGVSWFGAIIDIMEVSGIQTGAGSVDSTAKKTNTAASTTPSSPNASPATGAANELAVGSYVDDFGSGIAKGASWTDLGTTANGGVTGSGEWEDSGASGSTPSANWTLTGGAPYSAAIMVLKLAAAGVAAGPLFPVFLPSMAPQGM